MFKWASKLAQEEDNFFSSFKNLAKKNCEIKKLINLLKFEWRNRLEQCISSSRVHFWLCQTYVMKRISIRFKSIKHVLLSGYHQARKIAQEILLLTVLIKRWSFFELLIKTNNWQLSFSSSPHIQNSFRNHKQQREVQFN